jgi:hypothetical protein
LRKRNARGFRYGKIGHWLNVHILFGILGPLYITLHTAWKFQGIVSVSYYSMLAVMFSGFIGRYLYVQIPRALSGDELTIREIDERDKAMTARLIEEYKVEEALLARIRLISGVGGEAPVKGPAAILLTVVNNLTRRPRLLRLRSRLRREYRQISRKEINELMRLIDRKTLLLRKKLLLSAIQPLFHYWHVAHKPFALVMILIMFVHIAVALAFGYQWIF